MLREAFLGGFEGLRPEPLRHKGFMKIPQVLRGCGDSRADF
jgi:hypothetical protein